VTTSVIYDNNFEKNQDVINQELRRDIDIQELQNTVESMQNEIDSTTNDIESLRETINNIDIP